MLLEMLKIPGITLFKEIEKPLYYSFVLNRNRNVSVRWDSGEKFVYRIGAEDAHDLRVS
jgi:hypothetical protein